MSAIQILVGADPEVFVKQNGIFLSAHGLIQGDKKNPQKVRNGAVQVDGMALEFNIDPADSEERFLLSIQDVFNQLQAMVPDYEVVATPVADFALDYIRAQPDEARELGCDPDFDAYTGKANQKPDGERPMRTASGHIHIGWTNGASELSVDHQEDCRAVVKEMDFFLGLPSLFYDKDQRRREMYGKAACYRPKPYGVEYRTLSNAWLLNEKRIRWAYRAVQAGMKNIMSGNLLSEQYGDIRHIINSSDLYTARYIIDANRIEECPV